MAKLPISKNLFVPLQRLFVPGRTLLIPMLILALGLHAALLVLPLPSTEEQKTADDKKNPIKITQIPTEKPPTTASSAATVNVPPVGKASVSSSIPSSGESPTSTDPATDESTSGSSTTGDDTAPTSDTSSTAAATKPAIAPTKTVKTTSTSKAATSKSEPKNSSAAGTSSSSSSTDSSAAPDMPSPASMEATSPSSSESSKPEPSENPFANFPHYQPSKADCYGLGFGDNCRVVENGAIAQVADFFRKELAAQQFTANLVINEPTRRVYKVSKGNKTLFLNIWQGNQKVAYLLSSVVYKQSPEEIKTETPR